MSPVELIIVIIIAMIGYNYSIKLIAHLNILRIKYYNAFIKSMRHRRNKKRTPTEIQADSAKIKLR